MDANFGTGPKWLWVFLLTFSSLSGRAQTVSVPLGGNAWGDLTVGCTVWVRVAHPGSLHVSLFALAPAGGSTVNVSLGGVNHPVVLQGADTLRYDAGSWTIADTGYQAIVLKGVGKPGADFGTIRSLELSGPAAAAMAYVPNNEGNYFYWGRRGPSVHLNYPVADSLHVEWFYNEVTVPVGQDIIGSYFMADGFSVGYFGMQVNSATERRILFSVWSPFTTDDPKAIPDSLRIGLVRKGPDVHVGVFGDEGSGGQSYLVYPWVAGTTYRFLLRAQPGGGAQPGNENRTRFTAWFFAPEQGSWRLIASWDRPATHTWLAHLHSFLENFEPEAGDKSRSAFYGNQWIGDSAGRWQPLTRARFTGDNTARKGYRMDYAGGVNDSVFFLRNGGFFAAYTPLDSWFERGGSRGSVPHMEISEERTVVDTVVMHFGFDKSAVLAADSGAVKLRTGQLADSILLVGYTDTTGSERYNQQLSLRRALAVKALLSARTASRVEARGESNPIRGDDSLSRRVLMIVWYRLKDPGPVVRSVAPPPRIHADGEPDTVIALENINFIANTPVLTDAAKLVLPRTVPYLRSLSDRYLEINGYCNSPGALLSKTDPLFILSVKRAKFIYDYLIQQGFDSTRLRYVGRGNGTPLIAHPTTRQEMDQNMRVEIRVFGKKPD
jgi:outer membrane protein OmpA-like peptidoglycan-associated protein